MKRKFVKCEWDPTPGTNDNMLGFACEAEPSGSYVFLHKLVITHDCQEKMVSVEPEFWIRRSDATLRRESSFSDYIPLEISLTTYMLPSMARFRARIDDFKKMFPGEPEFFFIKGKRIRLVIRLKGVPFLKKLPAIVRALSAFTPGSQTWQGNMSMHSIDVVLFQHQEERMWITPGHLALFKAGLLTIEQLRLQQVVVDQSNRAGL